MYFTASAPVKDTHKHKEDKNYFSTTTNSFVGSECETRSLTNLDYLCYIQRAQLKLINPCWQAAYQECRTEEQRCRNMTHMPAP
jgi:hypothetical protein